MDEYSNVFKLSDVELTTVSIQELLEAVSGKIRRVRETAELIDDAKGRR